MSAVTKITLNENEEWPNIDDEQQKQLAISLSHTFLESDKQLQELLVERKILEFDQIKDKGIRIRTKSFIGTVSFSNFHLQIIPKIYKKNDTNVWSNILACINFIQGLDKAKILEYQKISFTNADKYLQDSLILTLVFECKSLLEKGLFKSYIEYEENLQFLRGKLILKNQFQNNIQKKANFFCEYDELEYDNIENRIIFYTLLLCERISISSNLKQQVYTLIQQFSRMVQKTPIFVSDIERVMRNYNRQNSHYADAHSICKLIIEQAGISNFYEKPVPFTIPFFLNMNSVFEDFVTLLFQKYSDSDVKPQATQKAWNVDEETAKLMKPDIILRKNQSVIIVDVKYKPRLSHNDLYQIGFYIHEYSDKNRDPNDNSAYAILPDYPKENNDDNKYDNTGDNQTHHTFVATKTKITIYEKHICLNDFIKLIVDEKIEKIKTKIARILAP